MLASARRRGAIPGGPRAPRRGAAATVQRSRLQRLLAYDVWANREALGSLRAARPASARAVRILGHILAAEDLWLVRIRAEARRVTVWPDVTLDECEARIGSLETGWRLYLDGLAAPELARAVSYTNSMGERWTNTVEEILTHVALHSAYHRGQIASDLRAAGAAPATTDFIHGVRQGLIE